MRWCIDAADLVNHGGMITLHTKPVRHAFRNVDAVGLGCTQLKQYILTVSGRTHAHINYSIHHIALHAVHDFDVIHGGQLKVQTPKHMLVRNRVVLFSKVGFQTLFCKSLLVEDLNKSATRVVKNLWL